MKKISSILLFTAVLVASGCNKFLDRQPLDSASSATFMQTEDEMNLALNGVYAAAFWQFPNNTPLLFAIESTTDLAIKRTGNAEDQVAMGDGGPFLIGNSLPGTSWNQAYKLVTRANIMLDGMTKGQGNVSAARYARLRAEALVLRAWGYYHIMGWFGDPVYFRKPLDPSEYETIGRTKVATVVTDLYKDLDDAAAGFDQSSAAPVIEYGRVNKGVALGLKARLAMLVKDYPTAKAATQAVISSNAYGLNPRYTDLFMLAGQRSNVNRELMYVQTYPTDILDPQNWLCVLTIPRQVGTSQSSHFPSQQLVDLYEGRDGQRIDRSAVTGSSGGVGYVWRKYVDSTQYSWETKTGYINMRYAEILLTYAEAKIELGETDASVLNAINAVRARAGQPAVTGGSADELREIQIHDTSCGQFHRGKLIRIRISHKTQVGNKLLKRIRRGTLIGAPFFIILNQISL